MKQFPVLAFRDFVEAEGDVLTTTSNQVAAVFGKRHSHVLRAIETLLPKLPPEHQPNFGLTFTEVPGPNGATRREPAYRLTRDGFTLLVMGFTGDKALQFKAAYISAFNAMEAYIKNQREGLRYQCLMKELECRDSERRGSFHGKGLNQRKQEKPVLEAELNDLIAKAQPPLLTH